MNSFSAREFETKNLQPSPDRLIADEPGRVGDITEGSGLERLQGPKHGPECRHCVCQGGCKEDQINGEFSPHRH